MLEKNGYAIFLKYYYEIDCFPIIQKWGDTLLPLGEISFCCNPTFGRV
jgi:hypothetical protein